MFEAHNSQRMDGTFTRRSKFSGNAVIWQLLSQTHQHEPKVNQNKLINSTTLLNDIFIILLYGYTLIRFIPVSFVTAPANFAHDIDTMSLNYCRIMTELLRIIKGVHS